MAGVVVGEDGVARCPWGEGDPVMRAYHDTEWGVPVTGEAAHLERLAGCDVRQLVAGDLEPVHVDAPEVHQHAVLEAGVDLGRHPGPAVEDQLGAEER